MSSPRHKQASDTEPRSAGQVAGDSARFAHELAGLVDGSLRNIDLALKRLRDAPASAELPTADQRADPPQEQVIRKLDTADRALRQMAALIERFQHQGEAAASLGQRQALRAAVEQAVQLMEPAASQRAIELTCEIAESAADLPAGPIQAVVLNGLRNAVEAIEVMPTAAAGAAPHRIDVTVTRHDRTVRLCVADTGPGLTGATSKPRGHGLGLQLCRDIARQLRGSLELADRPGGGAVLTLSYPDEALRDF